MNEYKDRKITRTSFLDDAFRKNLESALRFGNPLLVQVCAPLSSSHPASESAVLVRRRPCEIPLTEWHRGTDCEL